MKKKIVWPHNKDFAFTIIDDTDGATVENVRPIYEYFIKKNMRTTKTIWVYPPKDSFKGETILDQNYLDFIKFIQKNGFEIQLHNVGSGDFKREEILAGLDIFKNKIGEYPTMQINHSRNKDNLYWGHERFGCILRFLFRKIKPKSGHFYGDKNSSEYFWGDFSKQHIKFIRNRVFNGINTLKYDPLMPFKEKKKLYSNYWFSSSDGHTIKEFNNLISKDNIDKLKLEKGLGIVYTHFSCDFLSQNGTIDIEFKEKMDYLSSQNVWIAPASEILEYLLKLKRTETASELYLNILDAKWVFDRIKKRVQYGH